MVVSRAEGAPWPGQCTPVLSGDLMLLDKAPSWRQKRWPQPVNEAQDLGEQGSWDGDLRHLKRDVATMTHDLGADLDELLAQGGQGPVFHSLGQGQCQLWVKSRR